MARRRLPNLRRSALKVAPKRKFFLFCEGKNTEPDYFHALKKLFGGVLIDIEPVGGDPKAVVDSAISCAESRGLCKGGQRRKRNSFELLDEVWAVFDKDVHAHFQQAIQRCCEKSIGVARSNPCFEVWLILHFQEFERPDDRHAVQKLLKTICPQYDPEKGKTLDHEDALTRLDAAEARAARQLSKREQEGDAFGPPSTTVFELTKKIKEANRRNVQAPSAKANQ
ncbi:MAG: RloB family protein [Methylocella sp.]